MADGIMLTPGEAATIRKRLTTLSRQNRDIRIREPVRKIVLALDKAERNTTKRITKYGG